MAFIQPRINVDTTSQRAHDVYTMLHALTSMQRCFHVNATMYKRHVTPGREAFKFFEHLDFT